MIIDNTTNYLYLAHSLVEKYPAFYKKLESILVKYHIKHSLIPETKDIWCRDFMPVQIESNKFIQFRYEPGYLENDPEIRSNPAIICDALKLNSTFSDINLDGGNVVKWKDKVIISDRVFDENSQFASKSKLVASIEEMLQTQVIIIPQIKSDLTGHADGYVHFLDSSTILVNDLDKELQYWRKGMLKVLKDHNLYHINLPFFEHKERRFPYSAIGCYINFLEMENLIIVPVFEVIGNKDQEVINALSSYFPDKNIEPINMNEIAVHGGLMNCISWNILKKH